MLTIGIIILAVPAAWSVCILAAAAMAAGQPEQMELVA